MNQMPVNQESLILLTNKIKQCSTCVDNLPLGPRPVFQANEQAKILIVGQAHDIRVHNTGIPFNDPSGNRLRQWMNIDKETFYDENKIAIVPVGFCYPGTGKSGDLPPRPECAKTWRDSLLAQLPNIELTLVISTYAQNWHMKETKLKNLTETVKNWQSYWPELLPLPHPSPRNNIWLAKNWWFEEKIIPQLQERVKNLL